MQSEQNIISRIIDLDSRAESIRASAREEAARMLSEAVREAEEKKRLLELQTAEKVKIIAADSAQERAREITKVKNEFEQQAKEIGSVSSDKKDRAVTMILSGMRGRFE
ncbi:MAG: hypothetical protein WCU00_05415 [Candidatus Latescibacterota bacterium]|jgi:F0F1-type ATP synthase membrane subunit b/b'